MLPRGEAGAFSPLSLDPQSPTPHPLPSIPYPLPPLPCPQTLHSKGLASADHTTLLLNCYTKLKDVDKLDAFIYGGGGEAEALDGEGRGEGDDGGPSGDGAVRGDEGAVHDGSFSLGSKGVEVLDAFIQVGVCVGGGRGRSCA